MFTRASRTLIHGTDKHDVTVLAAVRAALRLDRVYGVLGTIPAAWSTNPTGLIHITDTWLGNVTGTGVVLGSSDVKGISFDLGAVYDINDIRVKLSTNGSSFNVYYGVNVPAYTTGVPNNMTQIGAVLAGVGEFLYTTQYSVRYIVLTFASPVGNANYAVQYLIAKEV